MPPSVESCGVFHYDVCEGGMDVAKTTINECLCAINFKFFPRKCLRAFVMRCFGVLS